MAFKFFLFLFSDDGLFNSHDLWPFDDIVVDPDIETINTVLDGIADIFDEFNLIELIIALQYLLPLHGIDEMHGDFFEKLFVDFFFEKFAELEEFWLLHEIYVFDSQMAF